MKRYKYTGDVEIHIPGVGTFEPNKQKIHDVATEINHPNFEEVKESNRKEESKVKSK